MPKLTHFRLCPFSRAIRMALAEARVEVLLAEERPWEWRRELLDLNPAGALPVLEIEGEAPLCGSYAISEHLSETLEPADAGLPVSPPFPRGTFARAEARRLVDWFHGKMHEEATRHLIEEKVIRRFKAGSSAGPVLEILRAARENLKYHLSYVEHLAAGRRWLAGEEMSYADMAAAAHLSCADYLSEIDWAGLEAARAWYARMKSRASFRAILAERLPGAPSPPSHYADPDF